VYGVHWRQWPGSARRWRAGSNGCTSRKRGIDRTSGGEASAARLGGGGAPQRASDCALGDSRPAGKSDMVVMFV
jgi:hypothetical protein